MQHIRNVMNNPQEYIPPVEQPTDKKTDCPVLALGFDGKDYIFLDARKQLIIYTFKELNKSGIDSLFTPYKNWLWQNFPKYDEHGNLVNINYEKVKDWLQEKAAQYGRWDSDRLRGAGCWLGEGIIDKPLYMHCGTKIYDSKNNEYPVGCVDGYVYEQLKSDATHPAKHNEDKSQMLESAYELDHLLTCWNWNRKIDSTLLLGWIVAAIMGGALQWRPMVFITGDKSTGKSTLQEVIKTVIGKGGFVSGSNVTSAGIYQKLQNSTLPVILDEMESDASEIQRQKDILNLIRSASTGSAILRGGENHKGQTFEMRSCFLMAGIIPPPMRPQELSRMTVMHLNKITSITKPDVNTEKLHIIGQNIRRKILQEWHRFNETLIEFQQMLMQIDYESRSADQFGTLLACYSLIFNNLTPTKKAVQAYAEDMQLRNIVEVSHEQTDAEKCLAVILQLHTEYHNHNVKEPISYILASFLTRVFDLPSARDRLRSCDLGLVRSVKDNQFSQYYLAIPHASKVLTDKLRDTAWAGAVGAIGGWKVTLERLDGVIKSTAVNFSGTTRRATLVPINQCIQDKIDEDMSCDDGSEV